MDPADPKMAHPMRRVKKMKIARYAVTLAVSLALLALMAFPAMAQDPQHGGSMTNTHNDIYIVQGSAENPQQIDAGYGHVYVKETISFENDDPLKVPDYGIVYVDPRFTIQMPTAKVIEFIWNYTVANYTLQLFNETDDYLGNFTGIVNESHSLAPGTDLHPDEDGQPHPRVNATYQWWVRVVSTEGSEILTFPGDEVVTEIYNDTVFDLTPLDLPPLGEGSQEADEDELYDMWIRAFLEPHPTLKDGFYRFKISDMVFEFGMKITIEVRYIGELNGGKIEMDKLVFIPRTTHTDLYLEDEMEALVFSDVGGAGSQIAPDSTSTGSNVPTRYTTEGTFSLVIREVGTEETDWGLYGRYTLLALLIVVLLVLVLWSGPRKKGAKEDQEEYEEDEETAQLRAELEAEKQALMERIKELDRRHDEGKMGTGVWNRKRRSIKAKAVEVVKQLDELDEERESRIEEEETLDEDDEEEEEEDEETAELREELEAEKQDLLERIKALDHRHDEGEIGTSTWTRKRRSLKAEAVEVIKELKELDEEE
jgi:hypothetical protein